MDLQHTLNRVESNYYHTYLLLTYYIKCRDLKKERLLHTQKKETHFFFFASFEEYKALFSTETFGGRRGLEKKREREAFNTKTLSLRFRLSLSLSLSLVLRKTER